MGVLSIFKSEARKFREVFGPLATNLYHARPLTHCMVSHVSASPQLLLLDALAVPSSLTGTKPETKSDLYWLMLINLDPLKYWLSSIRMP